MKFLASALLLVGISSKLVHAYDKCNGCKVVYVDDQEWGVENDDWCSTLK